MYYYFNFFPAHLQFPYCDGSHLKLKSKKQIFPLTIANRADELEMLAPSELLYEKQSNTSHSKASPRNLLCRDQSKGETSLDRKIFNVKQKRAVGKSCMMGESFNFPAKTGVRFDGDSEDALPLRTLNSCTSYEVFLFSIIRLDYYNMCVVLFIILLH